MPKKSLTLLSNVNVDLLKQRLNKKFEVYIPEGYDTWIQETLNPCAELYSKNVDAIVVLIDGFVSEEWDDISIAKDNLSMWKQGVTTLTERIQETPIFVSTVDFRGKRIRALSERQFRTFLQDDWYQFLQGIAEQKRNVYVFDLADEIADLGRNQFYSYKMWYMGNMPYSKEGILAVCKEIERLMDSAFEGRKKIIALDLDNTLWGGVIGEDGIEGIELSNHKEGQRFYDFQRSLKEMQDRGTLLTIVSKNNLEDAEAAISDHPYMVLKDECFVSKKINWDTKAENLIKMESELNLTENSFVFIDDNPAERETVKGICPDMLVPEFPTDTTSLKNFAEELYLDYFRSLCVLEEDKNRTKMYQTEEERKQEFNPDLSLDEYLGKLEMSVDIHRMRPDEEDRVVQLCGKTNQFNVTTKRYTKEEIDRISSNEGKTIYVAYLEDKYGKSGLISVLILLDEGRKESIDTFLMSCRVMGRKLEDVIINELVNYYKGKTEFFTAKYIPTAKNVPVSRLYDRLGFHQIKEQDGIKSYELKLEDYNRKEFPFYKQIFFKGFKE